jgi:hypothetical protein
VPFEKVGDRNQADRVDEEDRYSPSGLRASYLLRGPTYQVSKGHKLEHSLEDGSDQDQVPNARTEVVPPSSHALTLPDNLAQDNCAFLPTTPGKA